MNYEPYTVTKSDLKHIGKLSFGERVKWIRSKANEINSPYFTIPNLAASAGIGQATLSRIESGELKDPKSNVLYRIAKALALPMEVFQDEYYEENPHPFTIHGETEIIPNENLTETFYRVELLLNLSTKDGKQHEKLHEEFYISPIEYEELLEDAQLLVEKVRRRRERWGNKKNAWNKLTGKK